jgi:hypothetical protein
MPTLKYKDPADNAWKLLKLGPSSFDQIPNRNWFINGDFAVNQRNFSSSTTTGAFGFDRWFFSGTNGVVTYSKQAAAVGDLPGNPPNFARLVTSGHSAVNDVAILQQAVESVRILSGKFVTISFWAKAASGTPKVAVEISQSMGTGGSPSLGGQTYMGQVTLSTTWTRYTLVALCPTILGKVLGTNNDDKITFNIWVSGGTNFNARTGSIGSQNNTFDFWGMKLEEGTVATPFEIPPYAENLRACQRYFYKAFGAWSGYAAAATLGRFAITVPVPLRVSPTLAMVDTANIFVNSPAGNPNPTLAAVTWPVEPGALSIPIDLTVTGLTVGQGIIARTNGATAAIQMSAEI